MNVLRTYSKRLSVQTPRSVRDITRFSYSRLSEESKKPETTHFGYRTVRTEEKESLGDEVVSALD